MQALSYLQSSHNYPTFIPSYVISVHCPRSRPTRSSSVVTLARPPTSSSVKITDRPFRYASPCLWNQLHWSSSTSFWYQFLHFRLTYYFTYHFFLFCFTTLLIHNYISFTPGLKPTCFTNPIPRSSTSSSRTAYTDLCLHRFFWAYRFLFSIFPYF